LKSGEEFKLLYVGSVTKAKGVGDLLHAVESLRNQGKSVSLTLVGDDPNGEMTALAGKLQLNKVVRFTGVVPNEDVPHAMRASDAVVIPSRHEYPEGLPLTIYEALAARTPIIASNHPMFRGSLVNEQSALIFTAEKVEELASAISRLSSDVELYSALSLNSLEAWQAL
jgi:glycosyltransferase involved in cell wall biosynthesis